MRERECLEREQRAAGRRVRVARFPIPKTPDTFDLAAQPSINRPLVTQLMRGEHLGQRENILFMGNPGTDKTGVYISPRKCPFLGPSAAAKALYKGFCNLDRLLHRSANLILKIVKTGQKSVQNPSKLNYSASSSALIWTPVYNGRNSDLGDLSRLSHTKSSSKSPENFKGEKGKGGMATEGSGARVCVSPCISMVAGGGFGALESARGPYSSHVDYPQSTEADPI